jgi:uncharacterized protein (TIGR00725 family)
MHTRLPVISVIGSGTQEHDHLARPLGEWLARQGFHLLTGGGAGVMRAVSRAFHTVQPRQGLVLGIIPGKVDATHYERRAAYPNEFIEVALFTHLDLSGPDGMRFRSRNHINVLSADVVIALPGEHGTASEAHLAVRYRRPVIAFTDGPLPPALPPSIPVVATLTDLQSFVLAQEKRWPPREFPLIDSSAPYPLD